MKHRWRRRSRRWTSRAARANCIPDATPSSTATCDSRTASSASGAIGGPPRSRKLGVGKGDRVATIAPNTHQHLEQFYAIPQRGAVIVPMNYRLTADDFVYMANHSGAKVLCVHSGLSRSDRQRSRAHAGRAHFVALEGESAGWLEYEALLRDSRHPAPAADIVETDLLAINYTSGTTSRPKGVMITHRNAWMNSIGTLTHWPMTPADRYLWTLPMFHANGWTFTWTVTAAGAAHMCACARSTPLAIYEHVNRERVTHLCAAPTVLIAIANGPEPMRRQVRRGVRVFTAGAPPAAATIERLETELGWEVTHVYGLTETAPFISICEPLPEHAPLSGADRAVSRPARGSSSSPRASCEWSTTTCTTCRATARRSAKSSRAAMS